MWNSEITLEDAGEKAKPLGHSSLPAQNQRADSWTVLLADDVELFIELEKSFLRRAGFNLLIAQNGREALALVRERRPDLVFLDLYMPEMNGDECCREIKSDPDLASIPVIVVTHGQGEDEMSRCREAGCDEILLEPVSRQHFLGAARKFLQLDQRIAPRVDARLLVRFGPDESILSSYSINLSTGGLFLETDDPLPIDSPLNLEFLLPGPGKKIRCRGRVAWLNSSGRILKRDLPVGMGVQFLNLTLEHMEALRAFIHSRNLTPTW